MGAASEQEEDPDPEFAKLAERTAIARNNSGNHPRPALDSAVNKLGPGHYQLIVLLFGGGIYSAEGSLLLIVSLVAKTVVRQYEMAPIMAGAFATVVFVGLITGTIFGGSACDEFGRRKPVLLTYLGIIVCLVLCITALSFVPLLVAQFMLGFFLGFGLPAANAIVCESCPVAQRTNIYSLTMVLFSMGQMYAASGLWWMNPELDDHMTWRLTLSIGLPLPCFLLVGAYFFLLESPHWLISQERYDEAKEVIEKMNEYNPVPLPVEDSFDGLPRQDSGEPTTPRRSITPPPPLAASSPETFSQFTSRSQREETPLLQETGEFALLRVKALFSSQWRKTTLIMSYITFVSNFAYYGMVYGLPHTVKAVKVTGMGNISPAGAVFFSAVFEIPGVFLAILLGNTVGRRANIGISFFFVGLFLVGTIYAVFADEIDSVGLWSTFCVKMFISSGFIIVYLYLMEVYPTQFRATGLAFCMVLGRLGAFFCPLIYDGLILLEFDRGWFFVFMAMIMWTGSVLSYFLPFETQGVPLRDI